MPKKSHGFTLIELMIVVSIIAILAAVGAAAYGKVQENARNTKRQSDLKVIQSALEQYRADQGYYPASINAGGSITAGAQTYLRVVPSDPDGTAYEYTALPKSPVCDNNAGKLCLSYSLCAKLRMTTSGTCSESPSFNYEVQPN